MSVVLLDLNVLISLIDPAHPTHDAAHGWFARNRESGWATCPITENGCIRVLSSPKYPTTGTTAARAAAMMREIRGNSDHVFWPDEISIADANRFVADFVAGHQQVADVYLLGLAVHHAGRLATFDRGIPWRAVVGATADHLEVIGE